MDERDRDWRDRDWRRSEAYGRGDRARSGGSSRWDEGRSWSGADEARRSYDLDRDRRGSGEGGADFGRSARRVSAQDYGGADYAAEAGRPDYRGPGYRGGDDRRRDRQQMRGYGGQDRDLRHGFGDLGRRDYERERFYGAGGYEGRRGDEDRMERAAMERGPMERGPMERGPMERYRDQRFDDRDAYRRGERTGEFLQRAGERISSWFRGDNMMRGGRDEDGGPPRRYREDFGREARAIPERGHRGLGPKGYQRSDERINEEVHERLTDDPWLDASHIQVEVKNAEVTLAGHVDNREGKHRAERLIEDVSGVRHVQNNLRVDPDGSLTGAGRGYGSSALEAEMRRNAQAHDPGAAGASGASGRSGTGAAAERSDGGSAGGAGDPGTKRQ
jgi:hypothetical protein